MVAGADAQDAARDGFRVRVWCVCELPGAVGSADADDDEQEETEDRHALSAVSARPDAEALAQRVDAVEREIGTANLKLGEIARLKEQLTALADQSAWIADPKQKSYLLERIRKCLDKIG